MNPALKCLALLALIATATAGCDDQKQRITMLEDSNRSLMDDLQTAREELATLRSANADCQSDLAMTRTELAGMLTEPVSEPVVQGWTAVPGGAMIAIEGSVLFESGKASVRSSAKRSLDQIVRAVENDYGSRDIFVFGHTDDQPIRKSGWKDNYELSSERALAVVRYLVGRGVSPDRLVACAAGEHRPRVPNSSSSNRRSNRRVEIFALEGELRTASR